MKSIYLSLLTVTIILVAGCAKENIPGVNTIANRDIRATIKRVVDQRVIQDERLNELLALTEIRKSKTNDNYTRIQVFFKNMSATTYSFIYRFNWYDENGVEVENLDHEMWVKKTAITGDDITLTTIAPTRKCQDFKLRIKAANLANSRKGRK
jgi:uncharacterized protein YcfL